MNLVEDYLKDIQLFSSLDERQMVKLVSISKIEEIQRGDILFYEKDLSTKIYYIISGAVKLYKVDRFDNEIFLYRAEDGSFLFDFSMFDDSYSFGRYSNAELIEDSTILSIELEEFKSYYFNDMNIFNSMFKECVMMVKRYECIINRDIVFDGTAKVAHMLVNDINSINTLKKHEIAYMLHIQPETLSRILKKLERNNSIMVQKGKIKILDKQALINIYDDRG